VGIVTSREIKTVSTRIVLNRVPVLAPVILATQEAEIRRITVQNQPKQIVLQMLSRKNPSQKRAQGVDPKFKPQYHKK
jgi:hypothetical protein